MYITELYTKKLLSGETFSTETLNNDIYDHNMNIIIFLGGGNDISDIIVDNINLQLSGGFVLNHFDFNKVIINTSTYGVLLIGAKIKKTIF